MSLQYNAEADEHILVCLSSAPSNSKIIRTAAKMADAFSGNFTALYIETPGFASLDETNKKRLKQNMKLARQLGAKVETVSGDDVPYQIAEFARLSGVTKIVIGRSAAVKKHLIRKPTLTEKLIAHAPNIDIHIIPDGVEVTHYKAPKDKKASGFILSVHDLLVSVGFLIGATLLGYVFYGLGFTEANIITVYILGVLLISILTKYRVYSLASSLVSIVLFNFLFTEPYFTMKAYEKGYPATFAIMFVSAFISSTLAIKLKDHAKKSAQSAYRTKILFDTNQLLQRADSESDIIAIAAHQLMKLLKRDIIIYPVVNNDIGEANIFLSDGDEDEIKDIIIDEKEVAQWVLKNNHQAGATTDIFSQAKFLYFAIRVNDKIYGIVGIHINEKAIDSFESSILLSILGECAISLENKKIAREKEESELLAKNEKMRANLLRAISHDLRTPLTSISGNADNLLSNGYGFDADTKHQIYTDIYNDSVWLTNLVENLLSVTRLEDGNMKLNKSAELIDEIITEALNHINKRSVEHKITVCESDDIMLVDVDARLIVQVIINIVDNAIKYTPNGSEIKISTERKDDMLSVSIADNGNGIADDIKDKVFDMFYTGANKIADSRRSLGLGLALCKTIISAHGGEITVSDNNPHGAVFTFTLPVKEVDINE
ncbi:MAG: sensor histidine kinase KdpD [Eubacteriales bacterium]|nr:sensor histidine kinase KdpD [Eubacteriales bacterium]